MRFDTHGALGWRINRLSDRPSRLEIVGSACGYAFALLFVVAALMFVGARVSPWLVALPVVGALLVTAGSSLSTGHFVYRAWVRGRLRTHGVTATATVVDRWRLRGDFGATSCIRFEFDTARGPIQRVACDSTDLVVRLNTGDPLPMRYDPDDPRRLLVDIIE